MELEKNVDVRDAIRLHLKKNDRPLKWLAKKTDLNYNTLYSIFVQKSIRLSNSNLEKVNSAMDTNFDNN